MPKGYCIMPEMLTAQNGAKAALSGEFTVTKRIECPLCEGEGCSVCEDTGEVTENHTVSWPMIKDIYRLAVTTCALPHQIEE